MLKKSQPKPKMTSTTAATMNASSSSANSVIINTKIENATEGISNKNPEDYPCYYCSYSTNNEDEYEQHVVLRHPGKLAYPNKAEIEKSGLKGQGKEWEK